MVVSLWIFFQNSRGRSIFLCTHSSDFARDTTVNKTSAIADFVPGAQFSSATWRVTVNNSLRCRLQACICILSIISENTALAVKFFDSQQICD